MKANKIIVAMLVLIGFGSCANRPSKSKPVDAAPRADTTELPIRVMYGVPARPFTPPREVPAKDANGANPETPAATVEPAQSAQPSQPSRK